MFLIFLPDKIKYNIAKLILINHPVVKYFNNIEIDKTVILISKNPKARGNIFPGPFFIPIHFPTLLFQLQ